MLWRGAGQINPGHAWQAGNGRHWVEWVKASRYTCHCITVCHGAGGGTRRTDWLGPSPSASPATPSLARFCVQWGSLANVSKQAVQGDVQKGRIVPRTGSEGSAACCAVLGPGRRLRSAGCRCRAQDDAAWPPQCCSPGTCAAACRAGWGRRVATPGKWCGSYRRRRGTGRSGRTRGTCLQVRAAGRRGWGAQQREGAPEARSQPSVAGGPPRAAPASPSRLSS